MKKTNRHITLTCALLTMALMLPELSTAQCVMCKAVAEGSANGGGIGQGLNSGIMYIMGVPYLLMVVAYFAFFRKKGNFNG